MKMGIILIIVGAALTISGIVISCSSGEKKASTDQTVVAHENQREEAGAPLAKPHNENAGTPEQTTQKSNKEKGNEFEAYVADMLKANGISIKEWNQGSVTASGTMAENALNPDFFVSQPTGKMNLEYWIESKWRANLQGGGYFRLDSNQINRYRKIQHDSHRKVIILLGLGGEPSAPAEVFMIPLDMLPDDGIQRLDLSHYFVGEPGKIFKERMRYHFFNKVFKKKMKNSYNEK